jgi:hypothetical protein
MTARRRACRRQRQAIVEAPSSLTYALGSATTATSPSRSLPIVYEEARPRAIETENVHCPEPALTPSM